MYFDAMRELYLSPVRSILEHLPLKAALAVLLLPLTSFMEVAGNIFLSTPPALLLIVFSLWVLDLISGIVRVLRNDGLGGITSVGIRQSIVKAIEYAIFILACDLFASTGNHAEFVGTLIQQTDNLGAIILAFTELKSIDENLEASMLSTITDFLDLRRFDGGGSS